MNRGLASKQVHPIDSLKKGSDMLEVLPGMMLERSIDPDSTAAVRTAPVTVRGDVELYASDDPRHETILLENPT
jgi:hypothetical protein